MWIAMLVLAISYFKTDIGVAFLASIAGFIKSYPIILMVCTSILMITYMQKTGALQRITVAFKTLGGEGKEPFLTAARQRSQGPRGARNPPTYEEVKERLRHPDRNECSPRTGSVSRQGGARGDRALSTSGSPQEQRLSPTRHSRG